METGQQQKKPNLKERASTLLNDFRERSDSVGFYFRLNLMSLLCELMDEKDWTQKQLANAADMQESFVSRVINAESNCTFDVAGRLLFSLGVREGDVGLERRGSMVETDIQKTNDVIAVIGSIQLQRGSHERITSTVLDEPGSITSWTDSTDMVRQG